MLHRAITARVSPSPTGHERPIPGTIALRLRKMMEAVRSAGVTRTLGTGRVRVSLTAKFGRVIAPPRHSPWGII
jgi:hypothetical protein